MEWVFILGISVRSTGPQHITCRTQGNLLSISLALGASAQRQLTVVVTAAFAEAVHPSHQVGPMSNSSMDAAVVWMQQILVS